MRIRNGMCFPILLAALLMACGKKSGDGEAARDADAARTDIGQAGAGDAEAGPEADTVTLTPESLGNMDLKTEPARIGAMDMKLQVPGRITVDGNRTAKVSATLEGRVASLARDVGDRVAQGEVLGALETPELLDRPLILKAPVGGVIMEKPVAVGELVEKGKEIFTISDPRSLWLIGEVKEADIARVKAGQTVEFEVPAYPRESFRGKVARIGNAVEAESRTFEIRAEVGNRDGRLKPGMFADIRITTHVVRDALLVPDAGLQTEGGNRIVFVALAGNRFEKRAVRAGLEQDGMVQILEGVKAGENVVTEGGFTLKSELLKGELGEE